MTMLAAVGRSFSLAPKARLARPLCAATMDVGVEAPPRLKIKSIVEAEAPESLVGTKTVIKGWARTVRAQKALGFLEVNDGSSFGGLQCVFEGEAALKELKAVSTGCAVAVEGEIVELNPNPAAGAEWCSVRPRVGRAGEAFPPAGSFPVPGHGLLDTGNAARTMINAQTAVAAGLAPNPQLPPVAIRGVNGVEAYPLAEIEQMRRNRVPEAIARCT